MTCGAVEITVPMGKREFCPGVVVERSGQFLEPSRVVAAGAAAGFELRQGGFEWREGLVMRIGMAILAPGGGALENPGLRVLLIGKRMASVACGLGMSSLERKGLQIVALQLEILRLEGMGSMAR